jgi:glycine cleavage system H protein
MGAYPSDRKYTKDHEWARIEGNTATVGITSYAQESLGEVVYVELPEVGTQLKSGQPFGVVESTKAVSELFAPLSGKVVAINSSLTDSPDALNRDPHGEAWMVKVELSNAAEASALMDADAYEKHVAASAH